MKAFLKWTGLILIAVVIGLGLAVGYVALVRSQTSTAAALQATAVAEYWSAPNTITQTVPYGLGHGMMWRGQRRGNFGSWGMGPGMMGGYGFGHMGGMMGGYGYGYSGTGSPLTLDQAVEAAEKYVTAFGNSDLELAEVMEFSNHFYAEVEEKSTGVHAFELLVDRRTGSVTPEPGPNMMWNTKYGHMGWGWGQTAEAMTVTPEQARTAAQQWLDANLPGTTAAAEADAFYGYYTVHVLTDGEIYGMLSVNGYTGQVWYHTWHGTFVEMKELED